MGTTPSPGAQAAYLAGQRGAQVEHLVDADRAATWPTQPEDRAVTYLTPDHQMIDWQRTSLPGDVTAYPRAEAAVGGAA